MVPLPDALPPFLKNLCERDLTELHLKVYSVVSTSKASCVQYIIDNKQLHFPSYPSPHLIRYQSTEGFSVIQIQCCLCQQYINKRCCEVFQHASVYGDI